MQSRQLGLIVAVGALVAVADATCQRCQTLTSRRMTISSACCKRYFDPFASCPWLLTLTNYLPLMVRHLPTLAHDKGLIECFIAFIECRGTSEEGRALTGVKKKHQVTNASSRWMQSTSKSLSKCCCIQDMPFHVQPDKPSFAILKHVNLTWCKDDAAWLTAH